MASDGKGKGKIMKKLHIVFLALFAVLAFSAVAAGSASAEVTLLAEWLFNGAAITALLPLEATGEGLIATLVLGIEAVGILCRGIFDGSVGPNGEGEVTKVLNSAKEEIGSNLVGLSLSCEVETSFNSECGAVGGLAEIWVDNLPWHSNLFLMENELILDASLGTTITGPGYHVLCSNGKENLCVGPSSATMTNLATDVEAASDATSEKIPCTTGEGDNTGTGLIFEEPGTLQVSSV
jgi:hypothetical protein